MVNENTKAGKHNLSARAMRTKAASCLYDMMTDESLKPSDRLAAIKAALDYTGRLADERREAKREEEKARAKADEKAEDSMLRVVFENIPEDYAG